MRRLPVKFTKYRHQYEQLCRSERAAIYVQHLNGKAKVFEVIVIRVADRRPVKADASLSWVQCEPYECYPSSDSWGRCGFTCTSEADARAKYELLNDPAYDVSGPALYPIRPRARYGNAVGVV
jgi:hypothetical protein